MNKLIIFLMSAFLLISCADINETKSNKKLNQIQLIGSHNSYKKRIDDTLLQLIAVQDSALAASLDYDHIPIVDQLNLGLRNLEMDVYYDPIGGQYAEPFGSVLLKQQGLATTPYDEEGSLQQPGLKMFHVQDIDFRSHHLLFKNGLMALKKWSYENPDHIPVFITINAKDEEIPIEGFNVPLPFTKDALDSIDLEISQVLQDKLITPDMIRGSESSLEQAIIKNGWPLLSDMKGRFLFVLDEHGDKRDIYVEAHEGLKGRVMFVPSPEGTPEAGIMIMNSPKEDGIKIKDLVNKGYIVRTRADEGTYEARVNDISRFLAAKSSGAQIITTDYYKVDSRFDTFYQVIFEDSSYVRNHPFLVE